MSDIEKAITLFEGITARDPALATKYLDPERYVEHNPYARDGVEGVKQYVEELATDRAELKVIRAYQDGACVFTQADGHVQGDGTFFDVFRFEDGLIVEHWAFSAEGSTEQERTHSGRWANQARSRRGHQSRTSRWCGTTTSPFISKAVMT
jgi:predicted SnoaL-like aldol condensation-catalyzing enzyme